MAGGQAGCIWCKRAALVRECSGNCATRARLQTKPHACHHYPCKLSAPLPYSQGDGSGLLGRPLARGTHPRTLQRSVRHRHAWGCCWVVRQRCAVLSMPRDSSCLCLGCIIPRLQQAWVPSCQPKCQLLPPSHHATILTTCNHTACRHRRLLSVAVWQHSVLPRQLRCGC